jgi:hypothetical protein
MIVLTLHQLFDAMGMASLILMQRLPPLRPWQNAKLTLLARWLMLYVSILDA